MLLDPIGAIGENYATPPVAQLGREQIKKELRGARGCPRHGHQFIKVLRTLFKYAIKEGYRTDNPAVNFTLRKLG